MKLIAIPIIFTINGFLFGNRPNSVVKAVEFIWSFTREKSPINGSVLMLFKKAIEQELNKLQTYSKNKSFIENFLLMGMLEMDKIKML